MYRNSIFSLNKKTGKKIYVLDYKRGDVNGDLIKDNIYLVGEKPYGLNSPFVDNITLLIQDGRSKAFYKINLKENAGYNPTIFLGDFTGNKIKDILISIDSGGSGGYAFYYIYSYINNEFLKIFDHEIYNKKYTYKVIYKDNYQVEVIENNSKKYTIDIKYKGKDYLSEIYYDNGKLKEPIEGWINPLGGLYPIDYQRDGVYEIYLIRRIAGRYNADSLGYVQTSMEWNGKMFAPFFQTLGILG